MSLPRFGCIAGQGSAAPVEGLGFGAEWVGCCHACMLTGPECCMVTGKVCNKAMIMAGGQRADPAASLVFLGQLSWCSRPCQPRPAAHPRSLMEPCLVPTTQPHTAACTATPRTPAAAAGPDPPRSASLQSDVLWTRVRQLQEEDVTVFVTVTDFNNGGLTVDYMGIEGFIPIQQFGNVSGQPSTAPPCAPHRCDQKAPHSPPLHPQAASAQLPPCTSMQ